MSPDAFYSLTPAEFTDCVKGYWRRFELHRERDAWMLVHLLSPHTRQKLTVAKILGKEKQNSVTDRKAKFATLMERLDKAKQ